MRKPHYDARLCLLLPKTLADSVHRAAEAKYTSVNAYVRDCIRTKLKADKPRLEKEAEAA
jgi:predicted HicB family RNase H-like nuclease